jgi:hypothetical protein
MMPVAYAAALLGAVPLLWLLALRVGGRSSTADWWWMAGAFGVSLVADVAGRLASPVFVSQLYVILQAALFVMVLAEARWVVGLIALFLAVGSVSIALRDGQGLDVLLHLVAWGTVAGLAWRVAADRLKVALLCYFGLGAALWACYVASPGWWTWGGYQVTRLLGVGLWSAAAWHAARRLA